MVITGLSTAGCSRWYSQPTNTRTQDSDLVFESYAAADDLLRQAPWLRDTRAPMLTATFVDVNSFKDSSALGRIVAEQVSSRFAQQGFTMIQLTLRNNVLIKERAGEFALSREIKNLSQVHNASAVVVGTYAVGRRSVYVSARLIRAADSLVLAAYDYSLPLGPDTKALLARQ
jgi:TolB-like protein